MFADGKRGHDLKSELHQSSVKKAKTRTLEKLALPLAWTGLEIGHRIGAKRAEIKTDGSDPAGKIY